MSYVDYGNINNFNSNNNDSSLLGNLANRIDNNYFKDKIKNFSKEFGKSMRNVRKGTREIYHPFRLFYEYLKNGNIVYILDLYHKDEQ